MTDSAEQSDADTYAALTDETRVRIVLELAAHYDDAWSSGWLTFSELCERVGVEDTGRFSYHLDELQDEFVEKVDGQYRPRIAALEIASTIQAGTYGEGSMTVEDRETGYECPRCEEALVAAYRDHHLFLGCRTHGAAVAYPTPPRALDGRTLNEVIDRSLRKHACDVTVLRDGLCPYCWGTAGLSYPRGSVPESYLVDDVVYATAACDVCWLSYPLPLAHTVLGHHAVEALYAAHGSGPTGAQIGPRNLARVSDVSLPDAGPPSARLTVELGDDSLVLELDEHCGVVDHWRS